MKRNYLIPFALITMLLTGCTKSIDPVNYNDPNRHYVSGTLHDINCNENVTIPFVVNGGSEFKIYTVSGTHQEKAANYIASQVKSCTGVQLEVVILEDEQILPSSTHAIVIGSYPSFYGAGLTKTTKDIGITGYQIACSNNSVYIIADGKQGFQLGGLKFLELTLGYDLLYGDMIVFSKDGSVIPYMDVVERPDFDYRKIDDSDTTWRYGAGFSDDAIFMTVDGQQYHNSFKFIPPATYLADHPNWYHDKYKGDEQHSQLCYTAHAHPEEIPAMVEVAAQKLYTVAEANPELDNITFTIQDNYNFCNCFGDSAKGWSENNPDPNSCMGKRLHYNGSNAAVVIEFVNQLDDVVQAHYEQIAQDTGTPKREMHIAFFAYHVTELAPTIEVGDGYKAVDGIRVNDDVSVFTAFIRSNFINSFYDTDKNKDANSKAKSWNAVSNRLYAWVYETNFGEYLYPFNTFTSMHETYRFLKENNVQMIYTQGQHTLGCRTGFNRLKLYISSKLMINVNLEVGDIINKYFREFYGAGESYMREFYEEMVSWCLYQELRWPDTFNGYVGSGSHYLGTAEYWNESSLRKWEELCYKAVAAIEPLKSQDAFKYTLMSNEMIVESMFPRWALCNLFADSYTASELREKRLAFMADARRLGFDTYAESNSQLADWYTGKWGL